MFRNYIKTAWRNLKRQKVYTSINLTGFAIGLSVCILIMLYAGHEYSYDRFHRNARQIFWMQAKLKLGNNSILMTNQPFQSAPSAMNIEQSISGFLRVKNAGSNTTIITGSSSNLKFAEQNFVFADSNFFSFFSFNLISGNAATVLKDPFTIVLSRQAAAKYFGKENPIGKSIRYNNTYNFLVAGVAEEAPSNSSIKYDFVASISSLSSMSVERETLSPGNNAFTTYLMLKSENDAKKAESAMKKVDEIKYGNNGIPSTYIAVPFVDIHQHAGTDTSNTKYLYIFPLTAALVLLLALVNYMSLSTAGASIRAKEIGVRKVMGAQRSTIATQFFFESALYTTIGFILAFVLCLLFRNTFFNFLQLSIDSSFLFSAPMLLSYLGLFVLTVLLSALYPALVLSAFKPAIILYNKSTSKSSGTMVRKLFTLFQFSISIILIICAISINRQLLFLRTAQTGIDQKNLLMLPFSANVGKHYTSFQKEISSLSSIQEISVALNQMYKSFDMLAVKPENSEQTTMMRALYVDQHFIPMLGLKWKLPPIDTVGYMNNKYSLILNETAVDKLNLGSDPFSKRIDGQYTVAGVLKDFNYNSLENKIEGLCIVVSNDYDTSSRWMKSGGCAFLRLKSNANTPLVLERLKTIYEKYDADTPFQYSFMDEAYDEQYKAENRLSKMLNLFTVFTILIAALGLFGLATFTAIQRTKEIGIRKVLGASVKDVMILLSKDFVKLVLIAAVIASPIAWYFSNKWLENFAYRVAVSWWIFVSASLLAVVITLFTISFHAIKAAIGNPVKSLRSQ